MKLSKVIPAHTKTVEFNWCKKDWLIMSPIYRTARIGMNLMDSCFWCGYSFNDGDLMAIAQPKKGLNKVLCQDCAEKLLEEE